MTCAACQIFCCNLIYLSFYRLSSGGSWQLEDAITVEQFSQLVKYFQRYGEWQRSMGTTQLATSVFRQIFAKLLGQSEDDEKIVMLCNKVGISPNSNYHLAMWRCLFNKLIFFFFTCSFFCTYTHTILMPLKSFRSVLICSLANEQIGFKNRSPLKFILCHNPRLMQTTRE